MPIESLSEQRQAVENQLLRGKYSIETFRGPAQYAYLFCYPSERALLADIENADLVCDIASGQGGLTKICYSQGIKTPIIPVNPSAILPKFRETELSVNDLYFKNLGCSDSDIERIQDDYDNLLEVAFAHDLPFADETFDLVFDCIGVSHYAQLIDKEDLYKVSLREMIRIVKKGGRLLISTPFELGYKNEDSNTPSPLELVIGEVTQELGLSYQLRWGDFNGKYIPMAIAIDKPE